jgi:putative transcriptional regulator
MRRSLLSIALTPVLALAAAAAGACQSTSLDDLGVGKLLVSSRALGDPSFVESVVLLVQYDRQGTLGLMINRRTTVPMSKVLSDVNAGKRGSDPLFVGGPVELDAVLALLRSQKKPDDATSVLGDVYLVTAKAALEKALSASSGPGDLRLYLGYCGWSPGQLENELRLGGWWIFDGDPSLVFDSDTESMWSRLIVRTEQQIAAFSPVPSRSGQAHD